MSRQRPKWSRLLSITGSFTAIVAAGACSSAGSSDGGGVSGGATSSGGVAQAGGAPATGGTTSAGGAPTTTGGSNVNSGGALAAGGTSTSGGAVASGGTVVAGGAPAQGGANATGGAPISGGSGGVSGGAGASTSGGAGGASGGAGAGLGGAGGAAGSATGGGVSGGSGGAACSTPGTVSFSKNIRLNDDTGAGRQTEVALAAGPEGLVIAGWMDERSQRVCAFSVSADGGETWSKNSSIGITMGGFVGDPAVAIDAGGTIYAGCQDYGINQIKLMTSTDQGKTWSSIRQIQSAPDKPWLGGGTTEGTVFVSWLGNSAGIKRSLDRGMTWGTTQSLGNIIHGTAIVASTSGLVHVPYNLDSDRNQLRYLRSRDGGATWLGTRDLVANMGTFCFSCSPRQHPIVGAAADPTGKAVAITWSSRMSGGQNDDDVWLLFSKDGGDTWSQPIRVNDNTNASRQFQPWVAVDDCQRVHLAWTDLRNGENEIFYRRSADPTKGFEPSVQVTDGRGSANTDFLGDYKGIVVQDGNVLVVWQDTRRDIGDIYFSRAVGAAR